MTHKIGQKGQVVIPKEIRDELGLTPGTKVSFRADGERVVISAAQPVTRLGGSFNRSGMAARLLEDRAAEPR